MLVTLFTCLLFSAMFLASALAADPSVGGSVTVETDIAHGEKSALKKRPTDRIWSGVIMATNPAAPKPIPKELRPYEASLKRMFGYSQFEIVGTATEPIDEENEQWLLPVQSFSLHVAARRAAPKDIRSGYHLDIQLFQVKRQLVGAEAKLPPDSPLIIRGPECGKGELIIILQVLH